MHRANRTLSLPAAAVRLLALVLLQMYGKLVSQALEDKNAAIADLIARRDAAVAAGSSYEASLASKLAEAAKLQTALAEAAAARAALEAHIESLKSDLAAACGEAEKARMREAEADEELDVATEQIKEKALEITGLQARLAAAEEQVRDLEALNRGLEDDREELTARAKSAEDAAASSTARLRGEVASELADARKRAEEAEARLTKARMEIEDLENSLGDTRQTAQVRGQLRLHQRPDNSCMRDARLLLELH